MDGGGGLCLVVIAFVQEEDTCLSPECVAIVGEAFIYSSVAKYELYDTAIKHALHLRERTVYP